MSPRGIVTLGWVLLIEWLLIGIAFTLAGLVWVGNVMAAVSVPELGVLIWLESKHLPGGDDQW